MRFTILKIGGYDGGDRGDDNRVCLRHLNVLGTTVGELKSEITSLTGIPQHDQKLIALGRVLQPDHVNMGSICSVRRWRDCKIIHLLPKSVDALPPFFIATSEAIPLESEPNDSTKRQRVGFKVRLLLINGKRVTYEFSRQAYEISVLQLKQEIAKSEPWPPHTYDLICNGVGLVQDDYMLSDYGIHSKSEYLYMVLRLHRAGVGVLPVHERRLRRLVAPILAPIVGDTNTTGIGAALYPHALNRLNINSNNDPSILFHVIKETINPMIKK